jgi:beta-glucosidase
VWDAGVPRDHERLIAEAVAAARASEAAVIIAGIEEGEFRDRASLALPGHQEALIKAVAATGVPTTVVIVGGSAVTMSRWLDDVDAVLMAWYPGEEGGPAIASVLFGDAGPSGRLPITFPVAEGQLPLTYDHKPTGRGDDYVDLTGQPLFPFGHGLTYGRFTYSDLRVTPGSVAESDTIRVQVQVTNEGDREAEETVFLFTRDKVASVARPLLELKGFGKCTLPPGHSGTVDLSLPASELRFLGPDLTPVFEPGEVEILVGPSADRARLLAGCVRLRG